jgi:hypothetical protein
MNTLDTIFEDSKQEYEKSNIIQGRSLYKCKNNNIIKEELYILEFLKITNKQNFLKNSQNKKVKTKKLKKEEIINNLKKEHRFSEVE